MIVKSEVLEAMLPKPGPPKTDGSFAVYLAGSWCVMQHTSDDFPWNDAIKWHVDLRAINRAMSPSRRAQKKVTTKRK